MARKKSKITWKWLFFVIVAIVIANVIQIIAKENKQNATFNSEGIEMVVIPETMTNETFYYTGYTVYFNKDTHLPNCTVYELTRQETQGKVPRAKKFQEDPNLDGSATHSDYTNSGYDRGHMVPAGDMKWNEQAMQECFYMTNIVPQKKALNSGAWNSLEQKIRNWADRDSALIVITGPIVKNEDLNNTIGDNNVVIPSSIFKVVLAPFVTPIRAIAFIYPNQKAKGGLAKHVVSVDDVETATGMDFFSILPDDLETQIESTSDINQWNRR